jgi:hypothetical protein
MFHKEILGIEMSPDHRSKISAALKAKGIKPSQEALQKAAETNRAKPKKTPLPCITEGCNEATHSKGLCKRCYDSQRHKKPENVTKRRIRDRQKPKNPEHNKRKNLLRAYGITLEQYYEAVESCYNQCEICENFPSGKRQHSVLHVDHCHTTQELKGLLCSPCNVGIGAFHNDIQIMESAKQYLILHGIKEEPVEEGF